MTLVLDAAVVAKWVLDEDGSDRANALRSESGICAPCLIAAEVGNALWKAVQRRQVTRADALAAARAVLVPFKRLVPDEELHARALELAIDLKHSIYDCFYLALAERERAPLISADKRLIAAGKRVKGVEVRTL